MERAEAKVLLNFRDLYRANRARVVLVGVLFWKVISLGEKREDHSSLKIDTRRRPNVRF